MSPSPYRLRPGYTLTEAYRLVRGAERRGGFGKQEAAPTENPISSSPLSADPSTNDESRRCA